MSLLTYAGRLYSVGTLDARFTSSSKNPPAPNEPVTASPEGTKRNREGQAPGATPPRWKSPEFVVYGATILVAVSWMFKTAYDVSQCEKPLASPCYHS